jgi:TRAP-type C4-dicarboxylate transport system permease small subunit
MFFGFVAGITARYVFDAPLSWANELCVIAFVWVTFWTSDILLKEREHIVFDVLYNLMPPTIRRIVAIFITLSLAAVFLAALPGTFNYIEFLHTRHSTQLQVPMQLVFGCFLVFVIAVVISAVRRLWQLLRCDWQRRL